MSSTHNADTVCGCLHEKSRSAKTCRYCYLTKIGALPHDPPWCCGGPQNCPEAYLQSIARDAVSALTDGPEGAGTMGP